jgi:hypothetical protein
MEFLIFNFRSFLMIWVFTTDPCRRVVCSMAVGLDFGQKFKPDPRIGQIRQPNPRVGQPELEEIEPVTYKFLGLGQRLLFKSEI